MLGDSNAVATVPVKDLKSAAKFYEKKLGLKRVRAEGEGAVLYKSGDSQVLVYASKFAGSNDATAVTWNVGKDVDAVVKDLKAKGISFEHYDMPGLTLKGAVHVGGEMKAAWFKDPDGNIHALVSQ